MAKSIKTLAESINDAGLFRIVKTSDGYDIQKLQKDYSTETLFWSYEESTKSLRKAKKELFRLSLGQVV